MAFFLDQRSIRRNCASKLNSHIHKKRLQLLIELTGTTDRGFHGAIDALGAYIVI